MKLHRTCYQIIGGFLFLIFVVTSSGQGQSGWVDSDEYKSKVGLELMIPSFDDMLGSEFPTSALLIYTQISLSEKAGLKINVPISHFSSSFADMSETGIGNPYLGIIFYDINPDLDLDLGLRLPLASEDNFGLTTGALIENYNLGIYSPETFSVTSNLKYCWKEESGLIIKMGGGPDVIKPKDQDTELLANYYGQVLYGPDDFMVGIGITGLVIVTESDLSFSERSIHDLGITGSIDFNSVQTGAYLRITLDDDLNDEINFVLGLNLTVLL